MSRVNPSYFLISNVLLTLQDIDMLIRDLFGEEASLLFLDFCYVSNRIEKCLISVIWYYSIITNGQNIF
jgi:hypothetical protein